MHKRGCPDRILLIAFLVGILSLATVPSGSAKGSRAPARPAPTPTLIEQAQRRGEITRRAADLYLAYALGAPGKLPAAFRSDTPWHGTVVALRLQRALETMPSGPTRTAIERVIKSKGTRELRPDDIGTGTCLASGAPMPDTRETAHFYIEYNALTLGGGLTINDYAASLEGSWNKEVTSFRWAAPPVLQANPPPNGKYSVRIDELSPLIYGYVSNTGTHAGFVGNNPSTSWNDIDAEASCMVLNRDFSQFPGTSQQALDATTAHEFNHSLQYGYGALSGANTPDSVFVEGGATWMEDEVYDAANDNYNYLWPEFDNDMGEYEDSPYPYWITWRGLTERYGTNVSGGGENVMQTFWEITSRNEGSNLQAMNQALRRRNTTLPNAYHAYAIAVKFNRACGGGYTYPHCFQEGPAYVNAAGPTQPHGSIGSRPGSFDGAIPDNYALNWVALPTGGASYSVRLANTSAGGVFRGTVVCNTGSGFRFARFSRLARAGQARSIGSFNPSGCNQVVAVLTNQRQTGANPSQSQSRSYTLSIR